MIKTNYKLFSKLTKYLIVHNRSFEEFEDESDAEGLNTEEDDQDQLEIIFEVDEEFDCPHNLSLEEFEDEIDTEELHTDLEQAILIRSHKKETAIKL